MRRSLRTATLARGRAVYLAMTAAALGCSPVACALSPKEALSEYKHLQWTNGDQGLVGQVNSVAQSGDGYLWVGTTAGVFRFDGVRFTQWRAADPTASVVPRVYRSSDGSVLIGGTDLGLVRVSDERVETIDSSAQVIAMTEDAEGVIWYSRHDRRATTERLCSWDRRGAPHCQSGPYYNALAMCAYAGAIWIGADKGVTRFQHGQFTELPVPELTTHGGQGGVSALLPDGQNGLLVGIPIGARVGLERLVGNRFTPLRFADLQRAPSGVTALFRDREGALWIGTQAEGVYRVYDGRTDHYASPSFVWEFAEDREGSVWFADIAGLQRFSERRVVTLQVGLQLLVPEVDGVSVSRDGTLWVAGDGAFLTLAPGSQRFLAPAPVPSSAQVTSIFEDHAGAIWIGINDSLDRLEGHRLIPWKGGTGAPVGMIASIAEDRAHDLWAVSVSPRRILEIDPGRTHLTPVSNMPRASRVAADPSGGVYVAALTGDIVHVDADGNRRIYPHPTGRGARIADLLVTADGTVYASTAFGLQTVKDGRIHLMDERNGLPCQVIYAAVFDRDGNLWLYARCGVIRVDSKSLLRWLKSPSSPVSSVLLDAEDGANPFAVPFGSVARTPDGVLWFADIDSLQKVDPGALAHSGAAPPLHVVQFTAGGKRYATDEAIELPALARNIEIDYVGLSFITPDKVRFRYKLSGFDRDWTDAGSRREALYPTLPPGKYRFRVISSTGAGLWNEIGDSIGFEVAPAFYQTTWFKLLCGAALLALLWMILHIRVRQVAARVRVRQSIQFGERLRIARELHDSLLQSVQGLMLRFSAAVKAVPDDAPVRHVFEELLERSDDVIVEARNRIQDLREREGRSLDLVTEISALGQELGGGAAIHVTVVTNGVPYKLNADTHENVLLIAREAMLNSVKHAGARGLEIQIDYLRTELKVSVRDDGQGMDENIIKRGRQGHWGLYGMRERAAAIHGRLRILSKHAAGTEVELSVPKVYAAAGIDRSKR